jgi:membrane protein required for colicin V production
MNAVDWVFVGIILASAILASVQGFTYHLFSLLGVVIGFLLAAWEYVPVAAWYGHFIKTPWEAKVAAFLSIFLVSAMLGGIMGRLGKWFLHSVGMGCFDHVLGVAFGLFRGVLIVGVVLVALAAWAPPTPALARSRLTPLLLVIGRGAVQAAPDTVQREFRNGVERLREMRQKHLGSERDGGGGRSGLNGSDGPFAPLRARSGRHAEPRTEFVFASLFFDGSCFGIFVS